MIAKISIWLLATFLLITVFPAAAQQPKKIPRVGVLRPDSPPDANFESLRQGLRISRAGESANQMTEVSDQRSEVRKNF
jgi:hypothetical protein